MKSKIERLFDDADDAELVESIAVTVDELRDGPKASSLRKEHLHVWRVWESAGRASNGGFECLFQSWELDLEDRFAALEAIGATEALRELRESASVFPGGKPHRDVDERSAYLKTLSPEAREVFDRGGGTLYDHRILPALSDYVRAHKPLFLSLKLTDRPSFFPRPRRHAEPGGRASSAAVAKWLIGLGGTLEFHEIKFPNGNRKLIGEPGDVPSKQASLAGFTLPWQRRDTEHTLQVLSSLPGAGTVDEISLERCRLGKGCIETLRRFPRLHGLKLRLSFLARDAIQPLEDLAGLRSLDLSCTDITDAGLNHLRRLPNLSSLDVSFTQIGGKSFAAWPDLADLTLGGTRFEDTKLSCLKGTPALRKLSIYGARLAPQAVPAIAALPSLEFLLIWDTGLGEEVLAGLSGHPGLKELYLQGMSVGVSGAESLLKIPHLQELRFGDGKLSPEAKALIREKRRGLKLR